MKVLIFQSGEPLQIDSNPNPMRAISLSNYLVSFNFEVHIWSAKFNHQTKKFRLDDFDEVKYNNIFFKLIKSPGYKKNVSLSRIFDHILLARNLKKELKNINFKPDFVFIGYPPIETAYVLSRWCINNKIPYVLDVKDNWPDFFLEKLPNNLRYLAKLILLPYYKISKRVMFDSKIVTSISNTFLLWCQNFSGRGNLENDKVYYLLKQRKKEINTSNISNQIKLLKNKYSKNCFPLLFVGNHYPSIDLETVILGTKLLNKKFNNNFKLFICGNGETTKNLQDISKNDENIIFLGRVSQDEILYLSKLSKVFLCPFLNLKAFQMSLPNKVLDAFILNLPIVTAFTKGETFDLLTRNNINFLYQEKSPISFFSIIKKVYLMSEIEYKTLKLKIEKIYLDNFDYVKNNKNLIKHISEILKNEN